MNRIEALAPLRHRPYRRLLTSRTVSGLGDWLDYLGVLVLVAFAWDLGAGALAAVAVTAAIPWVALAPLAGVWADQLPGKPLLVGCDLARAALVLGYLLAPNLPVLLTLLLLKGCFGVLFSPAQQRAVKLTVPADDLLVAVSLNTFVTQATKIAGPALGGLIVAVAGPYGTFVADSMTFLASAFILSRTGLPEPAGADPTGAPGAHATRGPARRFAAELSEGFRLVTGNPTLRLAVGGMTATAFLVFTYDALSPLALEELRFTPTLLGVAMGSIGAGAVFGTVGVAQWGRRLHPVRLMGYGQLGAGVLVAVWGVALLVQTDLPPLTWLPVFAGIGAASAGVLVAYPYILQRETPVGLLGRVTATAGSVTVMAQLAAPPIGAAIASRSSIGFVFTVSGAGLALLGTTVMATRRGRAEVPEPEVVAHMTHPPGGPVDNVLLRRGGVPPGVDQDARSFFW